MKILAIRGKNLASLEGEFDIDFTTEPLKTTGIFAITGPTGAGKSTILDALCLALFDDAPRLNKAEASVNVMDVEDKTITQKDCRNILRRGSCEGYAEVDFIALNGDKFRSRWMVRRARGKLDGALQATTICLDNLTLHTKEQGTKKELLNRITEIIGLTFDQFTRAVLLAQGDFATFLKARQNEKAELLEKLTGTEVYSRISALIYQKSNEAKNEFEQLKLRIADIKILTNEELDSYNQEKEKLKTAIEPLKHQQTVIQKKLEWFAQAARLKEEIRQAEEELGTIRTLIREASPRYDYLAMIDTSQEIRDTYIDLRNKQKQLQTLNTNLQNRETELRKVQEQFQLAETRFKEMDVKLKETEQRYNAIKPEIASARELDTRMFSFKEKITAADKERKQIQARHEASGKNIAIFEKQREDGNKIKADLQNWFDINHFYKDIVTRYDLIDALLSDIHTAAEQKKQTETSLTASKQLLDRYTLQLTQLEEEANRLNKLLPTEVILLRQKLEAGQPCPVCGSTEHPVLSVGADNNISAIREEELEKAKTAVATNILQTQRDKENTLTNITVLKTNIRTYQTQFTNAKTNLSNYLKGINDWEDKLHQGIFRKELPGIVKAWDENQSRMAKGEQYLESIHLKLSMEQDTYKALADELQNKTANYHELNQVWKTYVEQRSKLLGGKTVDDVENNFHQLKENYTKQHTGLREQREQADKQKATVSGIIEQLKKDIGVTSIQTEKLQQTLTGWLQKKDHAITADLLDDIISRSMDWIKNERKCLSEMKERELILSTLLKEKSDRYTLHLQVVDKPGEGETYELLTGLLNQGVTEQAILNKRLTEVEVELATHNNGKKRIKSIESELNNKSELHTNWSKLNELLGSAKGDKFKTIAQGYTLDVLLTYANKHLAELSGRYKLEKIPGTLALQVVDNDMLGEIRTVHSLSGGESFLISLSLALGLSALSSNRMKIESLFIDEGFGALDIDTLNVAMDALDNLQTQGRKIGVISHVEEMKERVNVQIQVIKASNGRSCVRVVG